MPSDQSLRLALEPLAGLPEIEPGADLAALIGEAAKRARTRISDCDVLVVAQKVISKGEGRLRKLTEVKSSARARELAAKLGKDERLVQVILDESEEILRAERNVLITATRHGLVCANAGVDRSNVPGEDVVCLLPEDPDRSARALRAALRTRFGVSPAVVISDSFGRAWRIGQIDVAIGCAGLAPLEDLRGAHDAHGHELTATMNAIADQAAAAAALVRDKASGDAIILIRGLDRHVTDVDGPGATALLRVEAEDLFR